MSEDIIKIKIQLDETQRCVSIGCLLQKGHTEIELEEKDLPLSYNDFCYKFNDYRYVNGNFIYEPLYGNTEKEEQENMLNDMMIKAQRVSFLTTLSDEEAVKIPLCYPSWFEFINTSMKEGERFEYKSNLWKARKDISVVLEHQPPSTETASLYERIDEKHKGTIDDPIPYDMNMTVYKDLYYTEKDILYKCTRDSGQPLYASCESLVGHYFEKVN